MDTLSTADTWEILGLIKSFHSPMDLSDSTAAAWQMAFQSAGVTNLADAKQAVVLHYSDPAANQWIIPGDVIGHYRAIREERCRGIDFEDLNDDIDPNDTQAWLATGRYRMRAIADGASKDQALALPPPPQARHAIRTAETRRAALMGRQE